MFAFSLIACQGPLTRPQPEPIGEAVYVRHLAPAPSSEERYCAWFGDVREGILYSGQAAFWSAYSGSAHSGSTDGDTRGDPEADLRQTGPQPIGRFDLRTESWLPPLEAKSGDPAVTGTWDVHVGEGGHAYFTSLFDPSGSVEIATGRTRSFDALGPGLAEIAPGPDGGLLATRYGGAEGQGGSLLLVEPDGGVRWERALPGETGLEVAPKSVAFDPVDRVIWVTTDLVPDSQRHPTILLDAEGREQLRWEEGEVHFVRFDAQGRGAMAVELGGALFLQRISPEDERRDWQGGERILLDPDFPREFDFAQDLTFGEDGDERIAVTRWSGWVHVVEPAGGVRSVRLPAYEPGALYYTGALRGERLCATYCADLSVVCGPVP